MSDFIIPNRLELDELLRRAKATVAIMSPEALAAMRQALRESWVRGEMEMDEGVARVAPDAQPEAAREMRERIDRIILSSYGHEVADRIITDIIAPLIAKLDLATALMGRVATAINDLCSFPAFPDSPSGLTDDLVSILENFAADQPMVQKQIMDAGIEAEELRSRLDAANALAVALDEIEKLYRGLIRTADELIYQRDTARAGRDRAVAEEREARQKDIDYLLNGLSDIARAMTRADGFPVGLYPRPERWMAGHARLIIDNFSAARARATASPVKREGE